MKIFKSSILIASFATLFFILLTGVALAQDGALKIATIEGKVLVKVQPSADWVDAKIGQTLNKNDSIKTAPGGKAYLEFPDKSSFSLKPDSELTVEEIVWDATIRKVDVALSSGAVKTVIKKLDTPSEFKVKTPTAVCGARGTIFHTIITKLKATILYVEEGFVQFLNTLSGQSTDVGEGTSSQAGQDGSVSEPSQPSDEQKGDMTSGYSEGLVAEPYAEPGADAGAGPAGDVTPPEVTEENQASRI